MVLWIFLEAFSRLNDDSGRQSSKRVLASALYPEFVFDLVDLRDAFKRRRVRWDRQFAGEPAGP